ncbi:MAG: HD domain-containing protein [Gammaproteobacteria bacterium]|nr:HD domain-containing protein [Gammaproteobacteria bacterium]
MPDARAYAIAAHGTQRYGRQPYVVHLDAVAEIVGSDQLLRDVAYLHDVVEDTPITAVEIFGEFGAEVSHAIRVLTDGSGGREERKLAANRRFAAVNPASRWGRAALIVKAADRLANIRACLATNDRRRLLMYQREHRDFREAVFRDGLCDQIWSELDNLLQGDPRGNRRP